MAAVGDRRARAQAFRVWRPETSAAGMGASLRKWRHGIGRGSGQSCYVDETCLKVQGRWCCLYPAIDRDRNLIDTMLSTDR